eukprot:gene635-8138_t
MPKITEIFGKLCCGTEATHKQLLNEIYPKEKNGAMGKIGNFTQYAINNFDNLPKIGQDLENRIQNDVKQGNTNYAVIGCKIFESLVQSCHQEIISIRLNIEAVLKLFFSSPEDSVDLKIAACELLSKLVQFLDENSTSNLADYVESVINLITFSYKDTGQQMRVQIAALRTISKVNQRLQLHSSVHKIMPGILKALHDESDQNYDFKGLSNETKTLTDPTIELKAQDLRDSAADCFLSLAKVTTTTHIRGFMKSIFQHLDDSKLWIPCTFPIGIMKILLSGVWSKHGYTIINNFLAHLEKIEDEEIKISIVKTITTIIERQHLSACVGPTSIESLRGIIQQYISAEGLKNYKQTLLDAVDYMAKRGEHTSQNIDFIETCFSSIIKDFDNENWKPILEIMIVIAGHPATIMSGKHYPDKFIRPLLDQCMKGKPEIRNLSLKVLIQLMYSSVKIRGKDQQENISSTNRVHATFSKKQREDVYYCLYESSSLEDNSKSNYATILSCFIMLLTQFRNKDLEQSIPTVFSLQELRIAKATSNDIFVHTLIAAYFQVLCSVYTNIQDLKEEISRVIEARLNEKSLSIEFPKTLEQILSIESDSGVILPKSESLEILFVPDGLISSVDSSNMFDKDKIIGILNKSESIQQNYPNHDIKELFSRKMNEKSNDLLMKEDQTEYQKIFFEDDATEKSLLTDDKKNQNEDVKPLKEEEIKILDYKKLGEISCSKRQEIISQKKKLFNSLFATEKKKQNEEENIMVDDEEVVSDDEIEDGPQIKPRILISENLNSIEMPSSHLFSMLTYNL